MTKASLTAIYNALTNVDFEGKETAMVELEKEINRGVAEKAAKIALYDAAKVVVLAVLDKPMTIADAYEACKDELPHGFTKAQMQYGLTHYWAKDVVKTTGKVNEYKRA